MYSCLLGLAVVDSKSMKVAWDIVVFGLIGG